MRLRWILTLILTVASLAGAWFSYSQHNSLIEARAKLEVVRERAVADSIRNTLALEQAAKQKQIADSTQAVAKQAAQRARDAEAKLAVARRVRDSLTYAIDAKDGYKAAYGDEKRASAALRERGDSLAAVNDRLAGIVRDYGDASAEIIDATDESFLDRLVPRVGVGGAVGINPITREFGAVVGPTLSWEF